MRRLTASAAFLAFAAIMATLANAQVIDHPTSFTGQTDLTFTNNASVTAGGNAQLTPAVNNNRGSFWSTAQLPVDKFVARFSIHTLGTAGSMADGIGFCVQRVGNTAIGAGGGQMGYQGIATSVFVKFDNYSNESSTGMYQNGADPSPNSVTMRPNVDLHSQHDFRVLMSYNGTTLAMTVTDLTTNAVYSTTFTVNIPTVIGGATAYVGFTGATGGLNANQEVLNLVYVTAPTGLTPTNNMNQVVLDWTPVTGAASYNVYRGTTNGGPYTTQIATGLTNPTHSDNGAAYPNTYYYVVRAVVSGVEGPDSNQATGVPLPPPVTASPTSGLTTSEAGLTDTITLTVNITPVGSPGNVQITSSNPNEAILSGAGPSQSTQGPGSPITITIPAGTPVGTTIPITVHGVDDSAGDGPQNYTISFVLSGPVTPTNEWNTGGINPINGTNSDNDTPGITVTQLSGPTGEGGGTATFIVVFDTQPAADTTVSVTSGNTGEATVSPSSLSFSSTLSAPNATGWNFNHIVTVTGVDDAVLDFSQPFTISLSVTGGDPAYVAMTAGGPIVRNGINIDNETIPTLDPVWGGGGSGGCGLTGLEGVLVLALAAIFRRKR
jgi:hypothetical protein